ncbi:MAG: TonB C-terminal domain-containing protein, partial [Thermoanaerobaculia bacterium]|nr:TonB C-terminal domain-containing protein [Thermoanaerobaculia bacterium]
RSAMHRHRMGMAFERPVVGDLVPADVPVLAPREPEGSRRTLVTGSVAALIHGGAILALMVIAALAPVIEEELIPVQLLKNEPEQPDEPAPAPKALAERRSVNFAPQMQTVQPQIVNPRVVADASPSIPAEALKMEAVNTATAPTQVARANTVVERVSTINSVATATASAVDVPTAAGPAVRGPVKIDAPVGPSVGPRKVEVATNAHSIGTGTLSIGEGSSVRDGVLSNRDVLGSPDGAPLVSVNVAVGEGNVRGAGGTGEGLGAGGGVSTSDCLGRSEVQSYMSVVKDRMYSRWQLPPGVPADQKVTLKFVLDVAGSASGVELVRASDNALGASAVDALRAASPFPPIPERARCLAQRRLIGTFSNPSAG